MGARFVVLGLAQARSQWFRAVAQWSTSGSIPVEFVKCVSAEELRARLSSGRPFSALLLDGGLSSVDRDLIDAGRAVGCSVVVVDDARVDRDWRSLGADAVLLPVFDRQDLLEALQQSASPIRRHHEVQIGAAPETYAGGRASVAMVCGPGGTGSSTVAIALAQGLSDHRDAAGSVVLADFCRRADQAMLHDSRDIVPGVQELVDVHRSGRPSLDDVRALTYFVETRRYDLLLGLRQPRAWSSLRPRAFEAGFESLRRAFGSVVCDCDSDLEGEIDGGSLDVEERNVMARTAATHADVVFAVGIPGMKGTHSLVRVINDLIGVGVPPNNVVPVINRGPRSPRAKAEIASAVGALAISVGASTIPSPVFLPERRIDEVLRDGVRVPEPVVQPLVAAWRAVISRRSAAPLPDVPLRKVAPGSVGAWAASSDAREGDA